MRVRRRFGAALAVAWTADLQGQVSPPVVRGDVVYLSAGLTVHAFPAAGCGPPTCATDWHADTQSVEVRAAGCGASTCSPIASVSVPGAAVGMSVAAGRLFVTSSAADGARLTAFAPGPGA